MHNRIRASWLRWYLAFGVVLCTQLPARRSIAQPSVATDVIWDLAPVAKRAVKQLSDAYGVVEHLRSNTEKIQNGLPPDAKDKTLQGITEKLRETAAALDKEALPTDFDPTPFRVSVAEFTNCSTRADSLKKIRGYLGELRSAETRGRLATADLTESIIVADKTDTAVDVLIKAHETVMTHGDLAWAPVFKTFFELNWLDLTTVVRPAVRQLRSSLTARKKKIESELTKLGVFISNLDGNMSGLEKLTCLDGKWVSADAESRFVIEIAGKAVVWTERAKTGATLARTTTLVENGSRFRIDRPNDDGVLAFLGYQPSLRQEVLTRAPAPSFLILDLQGDRLTGEWHGLLVTKTAKAKLDKLIQPSQSPAKLFVFRRL